MGAFIFSCTLLGENTPLLTCRDVDAAPISRPSDCATSAVDVDKAIKSR